MEFDWVMGCGLGWFVGPKFLLFDGFGWVGSVVWVEEIGPMDNSGPLWRQNCCWTGAWPSHSQKVVRGFRSAVNWSMGSVVELQL